MEEEDADADADPAASGARINMLFIESVERPEPGRGLEVDLEPKNPVLAAELELELELELLLPDRPLWRDKAI